MEKKSEKKWAFILTGFISDSLSLSREITLRKKKKQAEHKKQ